MAADDKAQQRFAGVGEVRERSQFFQHARRQQMGLVDNQRDRPAAGPKPADHRRQRQPQLLVPHAHIGMAQLEQDGLKQGPPRQEIAGRQKDDGELVFQFAGQALANERLAQAGGGGQHADSSPVGRALRKAGIGLINPLNRNEAGRVRHRRERTFCQPEKRLVHRMWPRRMPPIDGQSACPKQPVRTGRHQKGNAPWDSWRCAQIQHVCRTDDLPTLSSNGQSENL